MEKLVNATKAAEAVGIAKSTLYQLVKQRRVTCYRAGDRVTFDLEQLKSELVIPALTSRER